MKTTILLILVLCSSAFGSENDNLKMQFNSRGNSPLVLNGALAEKLYYKMEDVEELKESFFYKEEKLDRFLKRGVHLTCKKEYCFRFRFNITTK